MTESQKKAVLAFHEKALKAYLATGQTEQAEKVRREIERLKS